MQLKDIIHFYYGCRASFDNKQGTINGIYHLASNKRPQVRFVYNTGTYNRWVDVWVSDIKLLLRPLSSMTEEEAKDFILITHAVNREQIRYAEARKNQLEFRIDDTYGEIQWSQLSSLEFVYLIQSGYDMFQFISRGLAIDITKLNKDEQ